MDAALAAGLPFEVASDAAADAVDEWPEIVEWAQRTPREDTVHEPRGPGAPSIRTPPTRSG